ncbi:hypothetical protein PENTCL1PPCAC_13883, partial [Pristionchus entomophagus]
QIFSMSSQRSFRRRRSSPTQQNDDSDEDNNERVKEISQLFLAAHSQKGSMKDAEVKKGLKDAVRVAGKQMRDVMGCQLRKDADRLFINHDKTMPSAAEGSGDVMAEAKHGLLTTVLMFIHTSKNPEMESEVVKESALWEFLEMLEVRQNASHPVFGLPSRLIAPSNAAEFVAQGWLTFDKKRTDEVSYDWGPRAYAVIDPKEILNEFCDITEDKPEDWKEHFKLGRKVIPK